MKWEMPTTGVVVITLLIVLASYDGIAVVTGGTVSSVSAFLITLSFMSPAFSFTCGALVGHLFLYMKAVPDDKTIVEEFNRLVGEGRIEFEVIPGEWAAFSKRWPFRLIEKVKV